MIAVAVVLVLLLIVVILLKGNSRKREVQAYHELIERVKLSNSSELPLTSAQVQTLLAAALDTGTKEDRLTIYKALRLAKSEDGTDFDVLIATFATGNPMPPELRDVLIREILQKRAKPTVIPILLGYARGTSDIRGAVASLQACRAVADEEHLDAFLDVIQSSSDSSIRLAAEETVAEILKKSRNPAGPAAALARRYEGETNDNLRQSLIRLLGRAGDDQAKRIIAKVLKSASDKDQQAALSALGNWPDLSMFETLMESLNGIKDPKLRERAFQSGLLSLKDNKQQLDSETVESYWKMLARNAQSKTEINNVIKGLAANESDGWAVSIVQFFRKTGDDDDVVESAESAIATMRENSKITGN